MSRRCGWILHLPLVVVDFKTNLGVREEAVAGYWRQRTAYAQLITDATGENVSELALVYCRSKVAHVRRQVAVVLPV